MDRNTMKGAVQILALSPVNAESVANPAISGSVSGLPGFEESRVFLLVGDKVRSDDGDVDDCIVGCNDGMDDVTFVGYLVAGLTLLRP